MPTYIFWFLMLVPPKPGQPVYIERFSDPVACQTRVIELREKQPSLQYDCRKLVSTINLAQAPRRPS